MTHDLDLQLSSSISDREWDSFLQDCPLSHHEQSSMYAQSRVAQGYQCDRVSVREKGQITGGAQILVMNTAVSRSARILRGPVAVDNDPRLMEDVVRRIEKHARTQRFSSLRVDLLPDQVVAHEALVAAGFMPTTAWYRVRNSVVIPLALSDEELLRRMHKKVAYYVRRSIRKGLVIRPGTEAELDHFYDLHTATGAYQGFPVFRRSYFQHLWRLFGRSGKAQHFVAYHNNRAIAAIFNVIVDRTMYYGWGGMLRDADAKHLQANYLLHYTAARWAREHGCSTYDLNGAQPFKVPFAVEVVEWPKPLWKFYGPGRRLRWTLWSYSGLNPHVRSLVRKAAGRFSHIARHKLPW